MKFRKTVSLIVLLSFVLLIISSVVMYIQPQGKVAGWACWSVWGAGKQAWGALHTNSGILFLIASGLHLVLNMKSIFGYLKNNEGKFRVFTADFNIALAITLIVVLLTLFRLPPVSSIQNYNDELKERASLKYGSPPYGHAESSSLKTFCKRMDINLSNAIRVLEKPGHTEISEKATLAEIAKVNHITPQEVYDLIRPSSLPVDEKQFPLKHGFRFGRKNFGDYCSSYGLDPKVVSDRLQAIGIEARTEDTMKVIADRNDTDPNVIFEAIRQVRDE